MNDKLLIPGAIVIAGIFIAGALIHSSTPSIHTQEKLASIRPVSEDLDYVRGAEEPKLLFVEFSDFECPFCGRLHPTLTRLIDEFPNDLGWAYRHLPLTSIHPRALDASIASECAGELAGGEGFWAFTDGVFAEQRQLGDPLYTRLASDIGIDQEAFETCRSQSEIKNHVEADREEAQDRGINGTPHVILVDGDGEEITSFSGALPYEQIRQIVVAELGVE